MGTKTEITWTDATWNVVTGCTPISEGCHNCYAARYAKRGIGDFPKDHAMTDVDIFNGRARSFSDIHMHLDRLETPLHWRKPRRIFVCSMGDLFHEDVPDEFIDKVFAVMALCPRHTFQVLTKRPERMREYFAYGARTEMVNIEAEFVSGFDRYIDIETSVYRWPLPLKNVWLGVSAENQSATDERIPLLLQTPAAVRFVSAEPMVGLVDLFRYLEPFADTDPMLNKTPRIDWVICGGESGPGARPMHPDWARSLRDQCIAAGVPFHLKQWGEWLRVKEARAILGDDHRAISDGQSRQTYKTPSMVIGGDVFIRVGKKASGHLLDGKEWMEFPEVAR